MIRFDQQSQANAVTRPVLRMASAADLHLFQDTPEDFDNPPDPDHVAKFLADSRNHMAIAVAPYLVGYVSAVEHLHPCKPPQLWLNDIWVAKPFQRKGIATWLMHLLCNHAEEIGCTEAWILSNETPGAMGFCQSVGGRQTGRNLATFALPVMR